MDRVAPRHKLPDLFKELQDALRINKNALEDVCTTHPEVFYRVADKLARVISERDALKQEAQEVDARVDNAIRQEAMLAGEKVTENDIKGKKTLHDDMIAVQTELHRASEQVGKWGALKEAYQQRGYVLRDLVQLHLSQYYGQATDQITGTVKTAKADYAKRELNKMRRAER